jgi:hypothetical protein
MAGGMYLLFLVVGVVLNVKYPALIKSGRSGLYHAMIAESMRDASVRIVLKFSIMFGVLLR